MWHLGTWLSGGLGSAGVTVGLDGCKGFFQPEQFCSEEQQKIMRLPWKRVPGVMQLMAAAPGFKLCVRWSLGSAAAGEQMLGSKGKQLHFFQTCVNTSQAVCG